jgi:ABC-type microcin C transport system permease subunit YejB
MLHYILRRILTMIPTLLIISMLVFVIIQLPPGDYLESHIAELQSQGESVDEQKIQFLREQYGLDKPMVQQYWYWLTGMLQADFGYSFEYDLPVTEVCPYLDCNHPVYLGGGVSNRDLLRHTPVQLGRLRTLDAGLPRSCHA